LSLVYTPPTVHKLGLVYTPPTVHKLDVEMRARLGQKAHRATPEFQANMKRKRFEKRVGLGKKPKNASGAYKTGGLLPEATAAAADASSSDSDEGE
jgi:hypothetical protein